MNMKSAKQIGRRIAHLKHRYLFIKGLRNKELARAKYEELEWVLK